MHGAERGHSGCVADGESDPGGGDERRGVSLIRALTLGAVAAWAIGAISMPIVAWIWLRAGGRRRVVALVAFAAGLVAQGAWLYDVAADGPGAILQPAAGMNGWGAWSLGIAGLAALLSGIRAAWGRGLRGLLDPDRAFEVAIGLFGVGVLLQQIARALA